MAGEARTCQSRFEAVQIPVDHGLHIGREGCGGGAFEFTEFRRHLMAGGDADAGKCSGNDGLEPHLVDGRSIGGEHADGDGLIAAQCQCGQQVPPDGGLVQRFYDDTVRANPLCHFEAIAPANGRRGLRVVQVIDAAAIVALHEQNVAEAACRNEGDGRAAPLQDRIGGHG